MTTSVHTGSELSGHAIVTPGVRTLTPIFNLYGTVTLVGGALYSAWIFWRKRVLLHRTIGNILIAVGALLPAFVLMPIAHRIGRVRTHTISLACMTAGYVGLYFWGSSPLLIYMLIAIVGIGWAAIVSLPFAIVSQKVNQARMGLYMGLFNLSVVLPQLVVSLGVALMISRAPAM